MESDIQLDVCDDSMKELEDNDLIEGKQSNSTKTPSNIPLKKQPEQLCNCPSRCDIKINKEWRTQIYQQFSELDDHFMQNLYIQRHIKIKSIAKRLWEDEIVDKKIQRRVTCKYLIPMCGTVRQSFRFAKTLDYDNVKDSLIETVNQEDFKKDIKVNMDEGPNKEFLGEISSDIATSSQQEERETSMDISIERNSLQTSTFDDSTSFETFGETSFSNGTFSCLNGSTVVKTSLDDGMDLSPSNDSESFSENKPEKETISDVNSPLSSNGTESVADENHSGELNGIFLVKIKYIEVCQKAFMNMYGITEKRIRWQREKLILRSRYLAEKKRKEFEEMDRTLALARSLGAGCQPLFALLEKSNCKQLSEQLLVAIEDDVALVNNFFHNQLWKPEDIMNKSVHFSNLDSYETECD